MTYSGLAAQLSARAAPAASTSHPSGSVQASLLERMDSAKLNADAIMPAPNPSQRIPPTARVIAIGSSTGGTQALEVILPKLKKTCAGIVIVQHMPEKYTTSFANRLNSLCEIEVREARSHDRVEAGLALIAPGGRHLVLRRNGMQYFVDVLQGPMINRHRPSVDLLFRSVACAAGRNGVGYILTGMGDDGAKGLKEMLEMGAKTFAQNESSCVVFGMPKEAISQGATRDILPLDQIAASISQFR
ncbi:chemotaxis protein CheB [Chitinibacter sp. SCUT-21]|uniref:chemotaxis protein CheB n=1 Tax=Chitinibacter sp. SCUT-21 TaxID=2970891 RepID=UPI0035A5BD24